MVSNNILAFSVGILDIKATIVAYVFSMQYFENTTTVQVAYAGLRVKTNILNLKGMGIDHCYKK